MNVVPLEHFRATFQEAIRHLTPEPTRDEKSLEENENDGDTDAAPDAE